MTAYLEINPHSTLEMISDKTGINFDAVQDALGELYARGLLGISAEKPELLSLIQPTKHIPDRPVGSAKVNSLELDAKNLLRIIAEHPGISEDEIRSNTGLSLQRVHHAMLELIKSGSALVETTQPSTSRFYLKSQQEASTKPPESEGNDRYRRP